MQKATIGQTTEAKRGKTMVHKRLCDVCGVELPFDNPYERTKEPNIPTGTFSYLGKCYDLCENCSNRVKRCITELSEAYRILEKLKKSPNSIKDQSDLSDFT